MINRNALTVIKGDARISSRHLQEALGFTRIDSLHKLIRAHEDELRDFGEVFRFEAENLPRLGGRPSKTFLLNEHQATAICLWAETPKARAARKLIIEVFTAWRKDQLAELPAPAVDPFAELSGRVRDVANHLVTIGEFDNLALRLTHLPIWKNGRRPVWWPNLSLRQFLMTAHRQMTLQDCRDEAVQRFGTDVPSISGIQRFWAQLDTVIGPEAPNNCILPRPQKAKKEAA